MHVFRQETLIKILEDFEGVDIASYGKPRDAFLLPVEVPLWTSGYGGKYEMRHTNVPVGAWVAVGNLEDLDLNDFEKLKEQLRDIDIYPTGHSGDFSGKDTKELDAWFQARSRYDDEANSQTPIKHAQRLTSDGLGSEKFTDLVAYLAENMSVFKDTANNGKLNPINPSERQKIVRGLLHGLASTVRYTRLDEPAKAYQIVGEIGIDKGEEKGSISLTLAEANKILVLRKYRNGEIDITPLDRKMLGRTYATTDGQPLGDRGQIELSYAFQRAYEIENDKSLPPEIAEMLRTREELFAAKSGPSRPVARPDQLSHHPKT